MMTDKIFKEAYRLHQYGFSILWLKSKSKAPIRSKWTEGDRESWAQLKAIYKEGMNVGTRLGLPISEEYFLAAIDLDVKSTDSKHKDEARKKVRELFPQIIKISESMVLSGRGNGSAHIYIKTKSPAKPLKLFTSPDKVKVFMPSAAVNKYQKELLSERELNEGLRIRPAWEISIMGEGQQVVLPPSIHPDSGKEYRWVKDFKSMESLPIIEVEGKASHSIKRITTEDWTPLDVDLISSRLDDGTVSMIMEAETDDRSAAIFQVTIAMVKLGFTDKEIMSVLTDTSYELAKASYDHAKTRSRSRAANWIYNYTIKKVRAEVDATLQFEDEVEIGPLNKEEAEKQFKELIIEGRNWRQDLDKNGPKGPNPNRPKPTLKNVVLFMENEVGPQIFKRNMFSMRDFYGLSAPWTGGTKDKSLTDDDATNIKHWFAKHFEFEPGTNIICEAMVVMASQNSFHPIREELNSLPSWDGISRIDKWLATNFEAKGHPEYLAQVFRKWLVASITRVFNPGAKFDWMPIFQGKQGTGKSSFGSILFGEKEFNDWLPNLSDKDAALGLQGIRCQEFSELASLRKAEIETVKAFITRQVDKVRPPYGQRWIESPRQCVFFGTTNKEEYLSDDTGNRRFCPIEVGKLNFKQLKKDRDQLWAEALFIYQNDLEDHLYLTKDAEIFAQKIRNDKMIKDDSDVMFEKIYDSIIAQKNISKNTIENGPEFINFRRFKLSALFDSVGPLSDWKNDARNRNFASKALKRHGFAVWRSNGENWWKPTNFDEKMLIVYGLEG